MIGLLKTIKNKKKLSYSFFNFFLKKKNFSSYKYPFEKIANNYTTTLTLHTYHFTKNGWELSTFMHLVESYIPNVNIFVFLKSKIFDLIGLNFNLNLDFTIFLNTIIYTPANKFKNNTQSNTLIFCDKFIYFTSSTNFDEILVNRLLLNNYSEQTQLLENKLLLDTYLKNEEKYLQIVDNQFWKQIANKKSFFYSNYELFEFQSIVPFEKSLKLNDIFYVNLSWLSFFSFNDNLATHDLTTSFYFEPFFFFWEDIQQSMLDFWLISHYRAWSLLFDDWVYKPSIVANDPDHIFPALSHLAHTSDFKAGFKILKWLFDYKNNQISSYYLNIEDIQNYAIDKNFVHLWNYWIGAYSSLNIFDSWGWTGLLNFFREWISSPKLHFDSKFYWTDNSYESYQTRVLRFAFFPDFAMLWGQFNPQFDRMTSGYNWFFHFGENYMDYSIALDLIWFQLTENYWGDFEYIVEDYSMYQATYFPDNVATIRIPIILLASKMYPTPAEMTLWINDYNNVFMFKQIKQYESLKTEIFFDLDKITWLEMLWDGPPIDQRVFHSEKIINLYFAYNSSTFISNQPNWLVGLTDPYDFYSTLVYDVNEDLKLEDREWNLISSLSAPNYNYTSNPSIYFIQSKYEYNFLNFLYFISEKIFDDSGYFNTSINRGSEYLQDKKFTWLTKLQILHIEYLPDSHYNWKITVFGSDPLEWNFLPPFFDKITIYKFISALRQSFRFEFLTLPYWTFYEYRDEIHIVTINLPTFYFEFTFQPLINLFRDLLSDNFLVWTTNNLLFYYVRFLNCIFPFYNFITILDLYDELTYIADKIIKIDNFYINLTSIYLKNFMHLPLVQLLINKMVYIADKIIKIDNFYINLTSIYLKNFMHLPLVQLLINKMVYIIDLIIESFFSFEHFDVQIHIYKSDNNNQIKIALDKVDITIKPLPIEFYLFLFKYPKTEYLKERLDTSVAIANTIVLPDLTLLTVKDNQAMERFIIFWSLLLLSNQNTWAENIEDIIKIINQLDYNLLKNKSLDYDWYVNYIVKHSLYKKKN